MALDNKLSSSGKIIAGKCHTQYQCVFELLLAVESVCNGLVLRRFNRGFRGASVESVDSFLSFFGSSFVFFFSPGFVDFLLLSVGMMSEGSVQGRGFQNTESVRRHVQLFKV